MFEIIVTNVLLPCAFVALLVALPLWRVLRGTAHDHPRPDDPSSDPVFVGIRTAAAMSGFGPFWYPTGIRPRVRAAADDLHTDEGDRT